MRNTLCILHWNECEQNILANKGNVLLVGNASHLVRCGKRYFRRKQTKSHIPVSSSHTSCRETPMKNLCAMDECTFCVLTSRFSVN